MIRNLFLCASLFFPFCLIAQKSNPKIDSLESVLKTAKDTNKVNTYIELVRLLVTSNPDKAIEYAKIAQKEAGLMQYPKGNAQSLTALGAIAIRKGNMKLAFKLQNEAYDIFRSIKDKKGEGNTLNNIARIYSSQSNYPLALEYYQKALNLRENIKDQKGILDCLNNIGAIYTKQANENPDSKELYQKSRDYYVRGLPIAHKTKNEALEASLLNNIGGTYDNQEEYDKALRYYQMALVIYEKTQNKFYLVSSYHSIGDVYRNKKDLEKAQEYQLKSLKIAEEVKDKNGIAQAKFGLANILVAQKKYADALPLVLPNLVVLKETGAREELVKNKRLLAEIYEATGDFRSAHQEYREATALKDSIFNVTNVNKMSGLQTSFELAKKDAENQVQNAKKDSEQKLKDARNAAFNYILIGILSIASGGAFLLYRGQQRQKKYNREIATEKQKSDNLLLNILPAEVAEELKEKGEATAQYYEKASVLFTDFQGFTKRTAGMTPREVINELNVCFSKFDAIIDKYNLEKIKTIGDAYMCAGGLPVANQSNPIDAVRAGLEMQQYMEEYRAECEAKGEPYFRCRLGINTGEVVAGVVGTKKFAYDIWGDTVNTASRAESGGEVGLVNITQSTYEEVKDCFECEYRGEIEVKGKGAIKMYFVVREKLAPPKF